MDSLKLRFISDDDTYEFEADAQRYPLQINNAFIAFKQQTGEKSGQLQIHHDVHGWHLICVNHTYPIITNPMALNYDVLATAIYHTVIMMSTWPVPEEQGNAELGVPSKHGRLRVVK